MMRSCPAVPSLPRPSLLSRGLHRCQRTIESQIYYNGRSCKRFHLGIDSEGVTSKEPRDVSWVRRRFLHRNLMYPRASNRSMSDLMVEHP